MKNYSTLKKVFLFVFSFFLLVFQANSQVAGSFEVHIMKWRFGSNTETYLRNNDFTMDARVISHSDIYGSGSSTRANLTKVNTWLDNNYPSTSSSGYLLINWETGPYITMRENSVTSSAFKSAESEILRLIDEVKRRRPNLKVSMYQMPYRFWLESQNEDFNTPGKFNKIFAEIDFIAPSYYILRPDEEVGLERNLQYLRDNLDVALEYGKKFNKPVIPLVWHKIHPNNSAKYKGEIMQKEAFARYIKYIYTYSHNNYKSDGVWWWDGLATQLDDLSGINNHLQGTVYNKATYDAMIVNYAKHVKQVLTGTTPPPSTTTPPAATTGQKVVSYTLVNANTNQDIKTITNDATLNLADLPTRNLNIRANTEPATVGSVNLVLSGEMSKNSTEGSAPYALYGGSSSDSYYAWVPSVGAYTLKATPYTERGREGTAGAALSITFSVIDETGEDKAEEENTPPATTAQRVVSYTLVNASTNEDIRTLTNNATVNLADFPTRNLNIRANTEPATVGSVRLVLSNEMTKSMTENSAPYALYGGTSTDDYNNWVPSTGSYTLKATPYTGRSGSGTAGTSLTINFTITNQTSNARFASTDTETIVSTSTTHIHPNPVATTLHIQLSEAGVGLAEVVLHDLAGKTVLTKSIDNTTSALNTDLDVRGLSEGVYILLVNTPKGRTSKRIVVQ